MKLTVLRHCYFGRLLGMRSNQMRYYEFKVIYELVNMIVTAAIRWCTGC